MSRKFRATFASLMLTASLGACAITDELPTPDETMLFTTGNYGGVYYPFGVSACRLWNGNPELSTTRCIALASSGSQENLERLKTGRASFALIQADALDESLLSDFEVVLAGPVEAFVMVLNPAADATSLDQLKGKRVSLGAEGSGVRRTSQRVLAALGWTEGDVRNVTTPSTGQQSRLLCQGELDAAIYVTASPSGYVAEAVTACGGIVAGPGDRVIAQMTGGDSSYIATTIPKESYRNMRDDIPTFGMRSYLIVRKGEANERVYAMTKLLTQELEALRRHHPALRSLSPEGLTHKPAGFVRHPAAERSLRESGLLK